MTDHTKILQAQIDAALHDDDFGLTYEQARAKVLAQQDSTGLISGEAKRGLLSGAFCNAGVDPAPVPASSHGLANYRKALDALVFIGGGGLVVTVLLLALLGVPL